jgi:hypothetical protein
VQLVGHPFGRSPAEAGYLQHIACLRAGGGDLHGCDVGDRGAEPREDDVAVGPRHEMDDRADLSVVVRQDRASDGGRGRLLRWAGGAIVDAGAGGDDQLRVDQGAGAAAVPDVEFHDKGVGAIGRGVAIAMARAGVAVARPVARNVVSTPAIQPACDRRREMVVSPIADRSLGSR